MEQPAAVIRGGNYDIYFQQHYQIGFYDSAGDLANQIISWNLNQAIFLCDSSNQPCLVRIYQPDLSEKIGDYPVISPEEAEGLLETGHYTTSVPWEMPGMEYVAKAELVYRAGIGDEYIMPYYRFYTELPEHVTDLPAPEASGTAEQALKYYGVYYVPAVDSDYLESLPVWDGAFQ